MRLKFWLLLLSALWLISCEYEQTDYRYNLGADFISDPTRVVMIDTLTVHTYTTATDSVITSREDRLLAGRFENKLGVVTTAESYFRLDPCEIFELSETAVFDSACFILYPDDYEFGDTTVACDLAIHALTENIVADRRFEYLYNVSGFAFDPVPLGTFSYDLTKRNRFLEEENNIDSIVVRVPDEYGKQFYQMLEDENDNLDSLLDNKDKFAKKYKGYTIRPANEKSSYIMGFNAVTDSTVTPKLRIYYHDYSENDELFFDYPLEDFTEYAGDLFDLTTSEKNSYAFSTIRNDYSKSPFVGIDVGRDFSQNKIVSTKTQNATMIQAGLDVRTRIEIPTIDELYFEGKGAVVQAILYLEPLEGTYDKEYQLPSSLELYLVDKKNRPYGQVVDFDQATPITAELVFNNEIKGRTYYKVDLTRFIRDEYLSVQDPYFTLQIAYPQSEIGSCVDQLLLGNQKNLEDELILELYISYYEIKE